MQAAFNETIFICCYLDVNAVFEGRDQSLMILVRGSFDMFYAYIMQVRGSSFLIPELGSFL